jgi:hypothetical protein
MLLVEMIAGCLGREQESEVDDDATEGGWTWQN